MTSAIQQYWRHTMKYAIAVIIAPRMNRMTATAIARQWQGRGQQLYSHSAHPPTHSPPYPLCFLVLWWRISFPQFLAAYVSIIIPSGPTQTPPPFQPGENWYRWRGGGKVVAEGKRWGMPGWLAGTTTAKKGLPAIFPSHVWHLGDITIDPGIRPTVTFGINFVTKNVSNSFFLICFINPPHFHNDLKCSHVLWGLSRAILHIQISFLSFDFLSIDGSRSFFHLSIVSSGATHLLHSLRRHAFFSPHNLYYLHVWNASIKHSILSSKYIFTISSQKIWLWSSSI